MALASGVNIIKGEVHRVVSQLRTLAAAAAAADAAAGGRRRRGGASSTATPADGHADGPLLRSFKALYASLQASHDLLEVDAVGYLHPFLDAIAGRDTPPPVVSRCLSAVNKFLLYGFLTPDAPRAGDAVNRVVAAAVECRCDGVAAGSGGEDAEATTQRVLELLQNAVRCGAGHLLTDDRAWDAAQCAYRVARRDRASPLLRRAAESTLTAIVLQVYSRVPDILAAEAAEADAAAAAAAASPPVEPSSAAAAGRPYGSPVLTRVLQWLSGLVDPKTNGRPVRLAALEWINVVLETGGAALAAIPPLVAVCQAVLSRYLIASSRSSDLSVLALALRVIFNLFTAMKGHLKVQLEVFFISVHLYLADAHPGSAREQRELALESLLEFAREPAVLSDLYANFDCDPACSNLYESLVKCLCRNALPAGGAGLTALLGGDWDDGGSGGGSGGDGSGRGEPLAAWLRSQQQQQQHASASALSAGGALTSLHTLSLEGVLAVVGGMAGRARAATRAALHAATATPVAVGAGTPEDAAGVDGGSGDVTPAAGAAGSADDTPTSPHAPPPALRAAVASAGDSSGSVDPDAAVADATGGTPLDDSAVGTVRLSRAPGSSSADREWQLVAAVRAGQAPQAAAALQPGHGGSGAAPSPFAVGATAPVAPLPPLGMSPVVTVAAASAADGASPLADAAPSSVSGVSTPLQAHDSAGGAGVAAPFGFRPASAGSSGGAAATDAAAVLRQRKQLKRRLALAASKFNTDTKGFIPYAQQLGLLPAPATPAAVARFLRDTPGLDRAAVGLYLSEPDDAKHAFNTAVRAAYVACFDFTGLRLDAALRLFLESFRLPGEAQKIERLMQAFAGRVWEQARGPMSHPDTPFILSYSIIMLNTDAHNPQVKSKMTKDQFLSNNRGIDNGADLPRAYLGDIFDAISACQIQMRADVPTTGSGAGSSGGSGARPSGGGAAGTGDDGSGGRGSGDADEADVGDHAVAAAVGATWDGVLKRQAAVSAYTSLHHHHHHHHHHQGESGGGAATLAPPGAAAGLVAGPRSPSSGGGLHGQRAPAGAGAGVSPVWHLAPHERDMFALIAEPVLSTLTAVFLTSPDAGVLGRVAAGFADVASLAGYFCAPDILNTTLSLLARLALNGFEALLEAAEEPAVLDAAAEVAERYASSLAASGGRDGGADTAAVVTATSLAAATASGGADGDDAGDDDGDGGGGGGLHPLPLPLLHRRAPAARDAPAATAGGDAASLTGSGSGGSGSAHVFRRLTLALRSALTLATRYADHLRWAWGDVVELYVRLCAYDCLPLGALHVPDFGPPALGGGGGGLGSKLPSAADPPARASSASGGRSNGGGGGGGNALSAARSPQLAHRAPGGRGGGVRASPVSPHFSRTRGRRHRDEADEEEDDGDGSPRGGGDEGDEEEDDVVTLLPRSLSGSTRLAALVRVHQAELQAKRDARRTYRHGSHSSGGGGIASGGTGGTAAAGEGAVAALPPSPPQQQRVPPRLRYRQRLHAYHHGLRRSSRSRASSAAAAAGDGHGDAEYADDDGGSGSSASRGGGGGLWGSLASLLVGADDGDGDDAGGVDAVGPSGLTYRESLDLVFTAVAAEACRSRALPRLLGASGSLHDDALAALVTALTSCRDPAVLTPAGLLSPREPGSEAAAAAAPSGADAAAPGAAAPNAAPAGGAPPPPHDPLTALEDASIGLAVATEVLGALTLHNSPGRVHALLPAVTAHYRRLASTLAPGDGGAAAADDAAAPAGGDGKGELAALLRRSQRESAAQALGAGLVALADRAASYALERATVMLGHWAVHLMSLPPSALARPPAAVRTLAATTNGGSDGSSAIVFTPACIAAGVMPHNWYFTAFFGHAGGSGGGGGNSGVVSPAAQLSRAPSTSRIEDVTGASGSAPSPSSATGGDRARSSSSAPRPQSWLLSFASAAAPAAVTATPSSQAAPQPPAPVVVAQAELAVTLLSVCLDALPLGSPALRELAPRLASCASMLLRLGPTLQQCTPLVQLAPSPSVSGDAPASPSPPQPDLEHAAELLSLLLDALSAATPSFLAAPCVWDGLCHAATAAPTAQLYAAAVDAAVSGAVPPAGGATSAAVAAAHHPLVAAALALHASFVERALASVGVYLQLTARENGVAGAAAAVLAAEAAAAAGGGVATPATPLPPGHARHTQLMQQRQQAAGAGGGLSRFRSPLRGRAPSPPLPDTPHTPPRAGGGDGASDITTPERHGRGGHAHPHHHHRHSAAPPVLYVDALTAHVLDEPLADLRAFTGAAALRLLEQLAAAAAPGGRLLLAASDVNDASNAPLLAAVDRSWAAAVDAVGAVLLQLQAVAAAAPPEPTLLLPLPTAGGATPGAVAITTRHSADALALALLRPLEPGELPSAARAARHLLQAASATLTRLLLAPPPVRLESPTGGPVILFTSPGGTAEGLAHAAAAAAAEPRSCPPFSGDAWVAAFNGALLPLLEDAADRVAASAAASSAAAPVQATMGGGGSGGAVPPGGALPPSVAGAATTQLSLESAGHTVAVAGTAARALLAASGKLVSDGRFGRLWLHTLSLLLRLLAASAPVASPASTAVLDPLAATANRGDEGDAARAVVHTSTRESVRNALMVAWADGTLELASTSAAAAEAAAARAAAAQRTSAGSSLLSAVASAFGGGAGADGEPPASGASLDLRAATLQLVDAHFPPLRQELLPVLDPAAHAAAVAAAETAAAEARAAAAAAAAAASAAAATAASAPGAAQPRRQPDAAAAGGGSGGGGWVSGIFRALIGSDSEGGGDDEGGEAAAAMTQPQPAPTTVA